MRGVSLSGFGTLESVLTILDYTGLCWCYIVPYRAIPCYTNFCSSLERDSQVPFVSELAPSIQLKEGCEAR